ncbi:hypothetical protein MMPV_005713 [Pyropia vietnamensis]
MSRPHWRLAPSSRPSMRGAAVIVATAAAVAAAVLLVTPAPVTAQVTPEFGSLGLGSEFSAGVEDGTVYVWGTVRPFNTEDVAGLSVYSVAAGNNYACMLLSSNLSAVCIGQDASSDARIAGTLTNQSYLKLSAGVQHVCGLTADFSYWDYAAQAPRADLTAAETAAFEASIVPVCWGNGVTNSRGNDSFLTPAVIGSADDPVVDVSVGDSFTCTRTRAGSINCDGTFGTTGDYDAYANTKDVTEPSLENPDGIVFQSLVAGYDHVCGVGTPTGGNALHCWGSASLAVVNEANIPTGTDFRTGPGSLASGNGFSCALRTDQTPVCWGGFSRFFSPGTPSTTQFSYITAGRFHVCGIRTIDSSTECWGVCEHAECNPPEQLAPSTVGCSRIDSPASPGGRCMAWSRNTTAPVPRGLCTAPSCAGYVWDTDGDCQCGRVLADVWTYTAPTPTPPPGGTAEVPELVFCERMERLVLRAVSCNN